jgi:hypothetical protein
VNYRNQSLLDLCHRLTCQVRIEGVCDGGPGEASHSNLSEHGHGTALKSHDCFVAAACRSCHREIDQGRRLTRAQKQLYWRIGFDRTMLEFWRRGWLKVV